jgi:hypothetical protein
MIQDRPDRQNTGTKRLTVWIVGLMLIGSLGPSLTASQEIPGGPNWQKVDAGAFSIFAPVGWQFHQLPGVDSYVGKFSGDDIELKFDFGPHTDSLSREKEPIYTIAYDHIDGLRAKVVSPKVPGRGITGVFFVKTFKSNQLCLYGKDLTSAQQRLVLKIFKTVRFGNRIPPVVPPPPTKNSP